VENIEEVKNMMTPNSIQRFMHRRAIVVLTLIAALVVSLAPSRLLAPAWADDPMSVVKTTVNQALQVLQDKSAPLAQRQDKLRQIVAQTFDFTEMAKSALGYHWKEITPAQQQEFTNAFIAFIEDSYLSKINDYRGQVVNFLRVSNEGGAQYAQVATDIVQPKGDAIHVNYRLLQEGGTWKIYDVTVDAISIIANYRNQFNRVMNSKGYDTLIADLKAKQAALAASLANH
jgi:phospholipid transport system substrate-binding protein